VSAQVAVAVVSWNTRDLLARCLESLRADHDAGNAEVWVIDNGSEDGSQELVRRDFPWVELIASDKNLGFGPAVNTVARRTASEWIAPANADIEVHPGAIELLLQGGRAGERFGAVAPRLVLPDGSTQHSVHGFPTATAALFVSFGLERLRPRHADRICAVGHWNPDCRRTVDWAHGAFLLVRRKAFDAIGGFDESQWMYAEDLDLGWRLARDGWHTLYEPDARVTHAVSAATEKAWGEERKRRSMTATYEWIRRRRGGGAARAVAAANLAGTGVRGLAYAARARLTGDEHAAGERDRLLWHMRLHRLGLKARPASQT
jgi:GT2 family glycosyltransferase